MADFDTYKDAFLDRRAQRTDDGPLRIRPSCRHRVSNL